MTYIGQAECETCHEHGNSLRSGRSICLHVAFPGMLAVYTETMSRRLVALLIVLVMGLQGPILSYAAGSTPTASGHCCPDHDPGKTSNGCSSCPASVLAGGCCASSASFAVTPRLLISQLVRPSILLPSESGSVSFATECPTPQFRPPIV